jgi:hypothetical protein
MTLTTILTLIGATVIILGEAERLPRALARLVRACIPLIMAIHHLRAALTQSDRGTGSGDQHDPSAG